MDRYLRLARKGPHLGEDSLGHGTMEEVIWWETLPTQGNDVI